MALGVSVAKAIVFTILLSLAYTASVIFYNVFLHPLQKLPGPLLGRATIVSMQKKIIQGRFPFWLHKLHIKYGPVVRYAPNEVSMIDPAVVKQVYGHSKSAFAKQIMFYGKDSYGDPPGLIRANPEAHTRQRKLVSHAFSDKALRDQQDILKKYVQLLISKMQEKATKKETVNLVRWFNFTTFDIMADLAFGEPLGLLDGSEYTPWVAAIFGHLKMSALSSAIRRWEYLDALFQRLLPKQVKVARKVHMEHASTRVDKRLARETDRPDIWTYVMLHSDKETGESLYPAEMHSNGSLFMIAGTETTATLLSGMTWYLLQDPAKMARLEKEVRGAFTSLEDIDLINVTQLPYLNACIEESLRIYPPVAMSLPRNVPKGGTEVCGMWLPEATVVSMPQYAAYHSESNFKNPDAFVPERWMPEGEEEYKTDKKHVFVPFSYGPRNCLGKNLTYHEMRLIFASLLLNFNLELADDTAWPD